MKLPPGATGFGTSGITRHEELRKLATVCHHVARRTNGTVTELVPIGMASSFHSATITYPDEAIAILRHCALPLLALAEPTPSGQVPTYWIDRTDLAQAIAEVSELRVLTVPELQPLHLRPH